MDTIDFRNTLATLGLSRAMCPGFDDEAYGAMVGLIRFRALPPQARQAWDLADERAMQDQPTPGQWSYHHAFYWQLRQLRLQAFFTGITNNSVNGPDLASYPWCLSDSEFTYCYQQVTSGTMPQAPTVPQPSFMNLTTEEKTVGGAALSLGLFAAEEFLKKYAPEMMATIAEIGTRAALPLALAGAASTVGGFYANRAELNALRRRYSTDATRRAYLATRGAGTYAGLPVVPTVR